MSSSTSRADPVAHRGQVDDHGHVLLAPAGVPPGVLVDPDHLHCVEAGRITDEQALPLGQDRLLAVFHDTARASATRATVGCWATRATSARRSA